MRAVHIVPHTHWDREWYLPFQRFRIKLIDTLDALLADLQRDPSFSHFLLDGQMAAVDDYLAVRPGAEAVLRELAAAGRLEMGPWYTLPDEFLVSGETLVRDLQLGLRRAGELGGALEVGYLPDMFGHIAQMPQLLRLFGFEHAVVWRGVPSEATARTGFWWVAPDGSQVRAEYLPTGYGNGANMPDDPHRFAERVAQWEAEHADRLGAGPILWMNGTDHAPHQPFLPDVLAKAAIEGNGLSMAITTLGGHLAVAPTDGLPTVRGELRSSARANLLFGVTSNRVDVRQAVARAERWLERVVEPLHAALLPAELWPEQLLGEAWQRMILNAAHDSVCACSDDDVVVAVLDRYAEARHIAEGLADRASRILAALLDHTGQVAINTLARARAGLVELQLPEDEPQPGEQLVTAIARRELVHEVPARHAPVVLERELDIRPPVVGVDFADGDDGAIEVVLRTDPRPHGRFPASPTLARMVELAAHDPARMVRLVLDQEPSRRVLVRVADVPGLGWTPVVPDAATPAVTVDGLTMTNGLVTVAVDPAEGTYSLDGHSGLGRLVDDGDAGDTYTWCPPLHDRVVDRPERVHARVEEAGPLRARITIESTYRWPQRVDDATGARVGDQVVDVATTVELQAGECFARVAVELDNRCEDHRLRAWFRLPHPAERSRAECSFATVERGLTAEGGPSETGIPTFPSRRFVQAGGLTIAHEGLNEYELVDVRDGTARALALTLLRASRYLSRGPMATRPLPSGPIVELAGSQVRGRRTFRYAVAVGDVDPHAIADDAFVPLLAARTAGLGTLPPRHQALHVEGAEVSAVLREGGHLVVRVFNPSGKPTVVRLPGRAGHVVDLRARPLIPFRDHVELGPWQIATLRLDEAG